MKAYNFRQRSSVDRREKAESEAAHRLYLGLPCPSGLWPRRQFCQPCWPVSRYRYVRLAARHVRRPTARQQGGGRGGRGRNVGMGTRRGRQRIRLGWLAGLGRSLRTPPRTATRLGARRLGTPPRHRASSDRGAETNTRRPYSSRSALGARKDGRAGPRTRADPAHLRRWGWRWGERVRHVSAPQRLAIGRWR